MSRLTWQVAPAAGIANRKRREEELLSKLLPKIGPGKFGCTQVSLTLHVTYGARIT